MPWVWSDELATRLVDTGVINPAHLEVLDVRPVAVSVDDPDDLVELARVVLGFEVQETAAP